VIPLDRHAVAGAGPGLAAGEILGDRLFGER